MLHFANRVTIRIEAHHHYYQPAPQPPGWSFARVLRVAGVVVRVVVKLLGVAPSPCRPPRQT